MFLKRNAAKVVQTIRGIWSAPGDGLRGGAQTQKHIQAIQDIFGPQGAYDLSEPVFEYPLTCLGFTNRSGSNLLGSYLRDSPAFSGFKEDLLPSTVRTHANRLGATSFAQTLRLLSEERLGESVTYGLKASVEQILMLQHFGIPKMYKGGLQIIEIRRDDIVGQAISYDIALQTGRWTSRIKATQDKTPICDPVRIEKMIAGIRASHTLMDLMVERDSIPRLIVRYEDIAKSPDPVLADIARFCGFDASGWSAKSPTIERQADATNAAFRKMFRSYLNAS